MCHWHEKSNVWGGWMFQVCETSEPEDLDKATRLMYMKNFVSVNYFWFIPCHNPKYIIHQFLRKGKAGVGSNSTVGSDEGEESCVAARHRSATGPRLCSSQCWWEKTYCSIGSRGKYALDRESNKCKCRHGLLEAVWSTCRSKSTWDCFQLWHLFWGNWYGPVCVSFPPESGCCIQQRLQEIKAADRGMTGCILCLCLRRWGSAVVDLNLCRCPWLCFLGSGKSCCYVGGVVQGENQRMERKSKQDRNVFLVLTLQPSWNTSGSLWLSPHPLAPIFSSPVPFLIYAPPTQISLASPNLSYPFHLPQGNHSVSQVLWSLPSSPLYPSPTPEFGLNCACFGEQPQCRFPPQKPVASAQPLFAHSLLTLPTSQLLPLIFTSLDSCWDFTVSTSCSCCPQSWSVTSTKLNFDSISGKPLISSGNRNSSVNPRVAEAPSAAGSSAARLASVLHRHPGSVSRFLTFFPAWLHVIFKTQPGFFPLTAGFGAVLLYDSITSFYSIIVLLIFIFSLELHLSALKELLQ